MYAAVNSNMLLGMLLTLYRDKQHLIRVVAGQILDYENILSDSWSSWV